MIALVVVFYIACGIAAWGLSNGTHRHASWAWLPPHLPLQLLLMVTGPIGLLVEWTVDGIDHFSLFPMTKEESWHVWVQRGWGDSPSDRAEFERWYSRKIL